MTDNTISLSSSFDDASEADWLDGVSKALKGGGIEKITRRTYDDISINPLYRESDHASAQDVSQPGTAPYLRGGAVVRDRFLPWDIRQTFTHPDPKQTNAEILRDLERGVSSIELKLDCTGKTGCAIASSTDLATALNGVDPAIATIALDHGGGTGTSAAALLFQWAQDKPKMAKLAFNIDPIGALARTGSVESGLVNAYERTARFCERVADTFPHATTLRSDARLVHEAGGSEAQELAALIAGAIDTLRQLEAHDLPRDKGVAQILFTLSVDTNYGLGVAKLRAARTLWARCLDVLGLDAQPMKLQAVSSLRMQTTRDPWVNMLRGTAACFAGAIGGADIVTIHPFNAALGQPEELGRRIARNTQIIAMEESQLGRVADPAGGAWFVETVADELADAAWALFQQIEAEGGYAQSLMDGHIQSRIGETNATRNKAIAKRKDAITGVSEFPLLDGVDAPVADVDYKPSATSISGDALKAVLPDLAYSGSGPSKADKLVPIRLSAPFEALRDAAEKAAKRPSIFLATLGPLAEHTARVDFARNLFASGGIEAKEAVVPPQSASELAAAFKASGCQLAVLCGADKRYADEASGAVSALEKAGVVRVFYAGRSKDLPVTDVFMGVDAIHVLKLAHAELGL